MNEQPTVSYRSILPYGAWAEPILGWHKRIREDQRLAHELVRFFQLAAEWLPEHTFERTYFGVQGDSINITIGNVWLACIGAWHGGRACLLVNRAELVNMALAPINGGPTMGFIICPWADVATINDSPTLWPIYAAAASDILHYPVAKQAVPTNKRGKYLLSRLVQTVDPNLEAASDQQLHLPPLRCGRGSGDLPPDARSLR